MVVRMPSNLQELLLQSRGERRLIARTSIKGDVLIFFTGSLACFLVVSAMSLMWAPVCASTISELCRSILSYRSIIST
jgi:hypothetical protein